MSCASRASLYETRVRRQMFQRPCSGAHLRVSSEQVICDLNSPGQQPSRPCLGSFGPRAALGSAAAATAASAAVATAPHRRGRLLRACAAQASIDPAPRASSAPRLAVYFALWYVFSVAFNIINKTCLTLFPMPWLISTWQLGASGLFVSFLWLTGLHPRPVLPRGVWKALLPVAFFHSIGHVAACVSFSKMAVSFTHVVKVRPQSCSVARLCTRVICKGCFKRSEVELATTLAQPP